MSTTGSIFEVSRQAVLLPADGWTKDGDLWACTVMSAAVTGGMDVEIVLSKESAGVPLCGIAEPGPGRVTVYAYAKPAESISAMLRVTEVRA